MHYYLVCIYVTSAEGVLECIYVNMHTHIYDLMVEVNMKIHLL